MPSVVPGKRDERILRFETSVLRKVKSLLFCSANVLSHGATGRSFRSCENDRKRRSGRLSVHSSQPETSEPEIVINIVSPPQVEAVQMCLTTIMA